MEQQYQVVIETDIKPGEMGLVIEGLTAFNAAHADGDTPNYLFITVRAADGSIEGGLIGATYLGWLQVQAVWVSDAVRGRGYGSTLMLEAEQEAVRRGCPRVFLETLNFQALPFYERRGYQVHSRLADFPPGGARYALTKQLGD